MWGLKFITLTLALVTLNLDLCWGRSLSSQVDLIRSRVKRQADESCYKADLIFVLDSSGSIKLDNWLKVLNFTKEVVSAFEIGTDNVRVGLNYYSNLATLAFDLNTYNNSEQVLAAIDEIPWKDQETNTSGGLRMMHTEMFSLAKGARVDAPAIGIVITDGESNRDMNLTIPEANIARSKGIVLFAIGIGEQVSQDELIGIGNSPPEDFVFNADTFDALPAIRENVVIAACQVASECTENGDWVVVLDSSGSVGQDNFLLTKAFVQTMVTDSNIDNGEARVGLITFSTEARVDFHLNNYTDRVSVLEAMDRVPFTAGTTNTAQALKMAREEIFTAENGDREDYRNVVLLFTDGGSNDFAATLEEARLTRLAGITILVVAITDWVNMVEIREMATDPDDANVFDVSSFDEISSIYTLLKRTICNDDNECSRTPCGNGGTCTNLVNTYLCNCPAGFAGTNCQYACASPADVVVMMDSSASMDREGYYKLQDFAKSIARGLNTDSSHMGLETYATDADMKFNLTAYTSKEQLINAISFPHAEGVTNTAAGLDMMINSMFREESGMRTAAKRIGVVVSDGRSSDMDATFEMAAQAHAAGISVVGVGVNVAGSYARREMWGMTSDPDDSNYVEAADYDSVLGLTDLVIQNICNDMDECASSPCQGGGVCVDKLNMYQCQCPVGRTGTNCQMECDGEADVVFVIDSSGSIRENRFQLILNFVVEVVDMMEVRDGRVRIGVISFGDDAQIRFPLNKYVTKEDIKQKVHNIPYTRGRTNMADALQMLREQMVTTENGAREFAPKLAIIITDGESTVNPQDTIPEAIKAKIAGIQIVVTSIENDVNNLEIMGVATKPSRSNIINVDKYDELQEILANFTGMVCDETDHCAASPCQNGGTCVDAPHTHLCMCTNEFTGPNCQRRCTASYDVTLILDASGSVDYSYEMAQDFATLLVAGLNFNNGRTRVAVVTYQDSAELRFGLDEYSLQLEVITAIAFENNRYIMGTNTAEAVALATDQVFSVANGDRMGVDNVAIVISDGRSNVNPEATLSEADEAKQAGIRVIAVGLGSDVNNGEIDALASSPESENAFFLRSADQMQQVVDNILDTLCN